MIQNIGIIAIMAIAGMCVCSLVIITLLLDNLRLTKNLNTALRLCRELEKPLANQHHLLIGLMKEKLLEYKK